MNIQTGQYANANVQKSHTEDLQQALVISRVGKMSDHVALPVKLVLA